MKKGTISCLRASRNIASGSNCSVRIRALVILGVLACISLVRHERGDKSKVWKSKHELTQDGDGIELGFTARKLHQYGEQEVKNCSKPAIANFPKDVFSQSQRKRGAVAFHLFVSFYLFWAIAVCCDSYFVPSLQEMCDRLGLQTDVAGATLMAIGSSAPELFAAIIGVFITKGDIGIGTILGSAVFNVLFVIGACGIFSGTVLMLAWWPMIRDAVCYGISLFVLTIVIYDGEVKWFEAVIMVSLYPAYVLLMYFNPTLERRMYEYLGDAVSLRKRFSKMTASEDTADLLENCDEEIPENPDDYQMMEMVKIEKDTDTVKDLIVSQKSIQTEQDLEQTCIFALQSRNTSRKTEEQSCDYGRSLFEVPQGIFRIAVWLFQLPITMVFFVTIPDVKKEKCRKFYIIGFIVSIIWIGILTYILVWMVTVAGYTAGITDTVMGLTFVAFGSSVPDCLSSLLVARQGDGDMAVSHTIGSNVFDILLCLGVPWLIKTTMVTPHKPILILSHGLFISCFTILGSLLFAMVVIYLSKWRLNKYVGFAFVLAYFLFLVLATFLELTVFKTNIPLCDI